MGGPGNSFFHLKLIEKKSFYPNSRAFKGSVIKTGIVFVTALMFCTCIFIIGCSIGEDESGSCKFHIISYGGGFQGWYIIDNNDPVPFSIDTPDNGCYIYSEQFETPKSSLYIFTTALTENTGSISIMLYKNDDLLASNSEYKTEDETLINEVNYTSFGDDDSE